MEENMEVRADMLHEEAQVTQYLIRSRHAQDRRLRRLQWAVTACSVSLFALLCFTLYQTFGNVTSAKPDKVEQHPLISGPVQSPKEIKPIAHLTGTRQSTAKTKDTYLQWESIHGLAYVMGDMEYENKSIVINKNGYYFVYAHVSLKIPSNFGNHFVLQIVKLNDNYDAPEVLFSGKALKTGQQTIYLSGLLRLTRHDRLKVNVTMVDQVDISSEDKTFFGAFWVTDLPGR